MQEFNIPIETILTVTQEDIDDIIATALEGGINYWCHRAEVVGGYLGEYASEQVSRGGVLKLYDSEDDCIYELTLEKLLHGIEIACIDNWYSEYGWCDGKHIDTCQIDASVADIIVQLALFNEVIYG